MPRGLICPFVLFLLAASGAFAQESNLRREHIRIAFGSCADNPTSTVWDRIRNEKPDLVLLLGDNIYLREGEWFFASTAFARYERLLEDPGFAALKREVPVYTVWDDHDFGPNDSDASFPFASITRGAFRRAWPENPPGPAALVGYASFAFDAGPARIIMTDSRMARRYPRNGIEGRLFGPDQLAWISTEMLGTDQPVTVIASGNQILSRGGSSERLGVYPNEEASLMRFVGESPSYPIFLSGDQHFGEILELRDGDRRILDITSSPLTAAPRPVTLVAPRAKRASGPIVSHGDLLGAHNFGVLDIEVTANAINVTATIVGGDPATPVLSRSLRVLPATEARHSKPTSP